MQHVYFIIIIFVRRNYFNEQPDADETCICNANGINTDTARNDEHIRRDHVIVDR